MAEEKPESSKKSKRSTGEIAADEKPKADATPKPAKVETKAKAKKSKAEKGAMEQESSTVAPDFAMDEGPFEKLLESNKGQPLVAEENLAATAPSATRTVKAAKKPAKELKASKTESASTAKKEIEAGTEKVTKPVKNKAPASEIAADVANVVKKGARAGTERAKKAAKPMAPATETPAGVADAVRGSRIGAEKMNKRAKPKDSKLTTEDESVNLTEYSEEQLEHETSKPKERKAPASADAEILKTDLPDPLSEHASAKKKQKKRNTKSKVLVNAVGELIATATEGANAAKASLGGLATSIIGGPSEPAVVEADAEKSANNSDEKAKGSSRVTAEAVAESSGKKAPIDGPGVVDSEDDFEDEPDDHTTALIAGLDSDGDQGSADGPGFQQGQKIPRLPEAETTTKKLQDVKNGADEGPGVVYVGRIPHGFYEHEMREYFSQFGDISRLRLSRSHKSGASRHYAFIEFASAGVAKIVANTMDNYLMFGHILKCKVVAKEQVHESLWKGANKRFKAVPWNKIEGRKFEMGLGREQWAGRIEGERKRRASKHENTKAIGYEFEAGELKGVDEVRAGDAANRVGNGEKVEEEKSLVTTVGEDGNGPTTVVVSEKVKTKGVKKVKGKTEETTAAGAKKTKRALDAGEVREDSVAKKTRRGKNGAD